MWAIPTGTSSVFKKKKKSGKESQYLVSRPGNRFGSANRVGPGNRGLDNNTPIKQSFVEPFLKSRFSCLLLYSRHMCYLKHQRPRTLHPLIWLSLNLAFIPFVRKSHEPFISYLHDTIYFRSKTLLVALFFGFSLKKPHTN